MPRSRETKSDLEALAHHLEAASSYAEQLGLSELQRRIDANSKEVKALMSNREGGERT
jgi:hypothetical protein